MLWFYIVDHCDNIGLCELDWALISRDCDIKITESHLNELGDRVQRVCNGKVYVTKFIPFQYGKLRASCPPHQKLIEAVKFHGLVSNFIGYEYPSARVVDRVADTHKEEEEEKEQEKEPEKDSAKLSDEDWLKSLQSEEAYKGINVQAEYSKMTNWCRTNNKQPSRRRFINWLNRVEKPMQAPVNRNPGFIPGGLL